MPDIEGRVRMTPPPPRASGLLPNANTKRDAALRLLRTHPAGLSIPEMDRALYGDAVPRYGASQLVRGLRKYPILGVVVENGIVRIDALAAAARDVKKIIEAGKRGFAPYYPREENARLIVHIQAVLDEYAAYLPMTQRQIFYRLVARFLYPKTEAFANRLSNVLTDARRGKMIAFDDIRDDSGTWLEPPIWTPTSARRHLRRWPREQYRVDRQDGQPRRLIVACEAEGMADQLYYGVSGQRRRTAAWCRRLRKGHAEP